VRYLIRESWRGFTCTKLNGKIEHQITLTMTKILFAILFCRFALVVVFVAEWCFQGAVTYTPHLSSSSFPAMVGLLHALNAFLLHEACISAACSRRVHEPPNSIPSYGAAFQIRTLHSPHAGHEYSACVTWKKRYAFCVQLGAANA
jgi:hypothetical protein